MESGRYLDLDFVNMLFFALYWDSVRRENKHINMFVNNLVTKR